MNFIGGIVAICVGIPFLFGELPGVGGVFMALGGATTLIGAGMLWPPVPRLKINKKVKEMRERHEDNRRRFEAESE